MRLRDLLHAADRMQKGRTFKLAASGVVVVAAIAIIIAYAISLRNAAAPDLDGLIPSPPQSVGTHNFAHSFGEGVGR